MRDTLFKDIHDKLIEDMGLSRQEVKAFYGWCANKDSMRIQVAKELYVNMFGIHSDTIQLECYAESSLKAGEVFVNKVKEGV